MVSQDLPEETGFHPRARPCRELDLGRSGGAIQSEPLYAVVEMLAVIVAARAMRGDSIRTGVLLGLLVAACVLIRHVGVCLATAVMLDLGLRRHWRTLWPAVLAGGVIVVPWLVWLGAVRQNTQLGLLASTSMAGRIPGQAFFYVQRIPDQIIGPFVEVATVFRRSGIVALAANLWAVAATGIIVWGCIISIRSSRRRLAGLGALISVALLLVWPFTEAGRFLYVILPFLIVGAGEGLARMAALVKPGRPREWACWIILASSIPYATYAVASGRASRERQTHQDFDAACEWISGSATRPGPVLTRHPGEVYWQTGRLAIAPDSPDVDAIERLIDRFQVSYLLIDEDRFANESASPLALYVEQNSGRVKSVWQKSRGGALIQLFEILRPR